MTASFRQWVTDHDDRWTFTLFYVGGAVLLSIFLNLFWVMMLMLVHLGLEIWRHVLLQSRHPFLEALWHVKLDICLLVFALVVALYADTVMGVLGIGQAARAGQAVRGAQVVARFGIVERGLRVFFLTVDDMARVARIVFKFARAPHSGNAAEVEMAEIRDDLAEEEQILHGAGYRPHRPWHRLSGADWLCFVFGGICLVLIMLAPYLTSRDLSEVLRTLWEQLLP